MQNMCKSYANVRRMAKIPGNDMVTERYGRDATAMEPFRERDSHFERL